MISITRVLPFWLISFFMNMNQILCSDWKSPNKVIWPLYIFTEDLWLLLYK